MSTAEERETIHRALTGDQHAYRSLYRTHRDRNPTTIAQRTKDPDFVDDRPYPELVERLNSPVGTLKTWLFRGRQLVRQTLGDID